MSVQPKPYLTSQEYLAYERAAEFKSEYLNGEAFVMAGASPHHVLIVTNVVSGLHIQLKKSPCTVFSTDLRVNIPATGLYTYPDIAVVCGKLEFDQNDDETIVNPTLIVEVLSDSTKDYDRGGKFMHYRASQSFREYVLIAQEEVHVEHFVRQPDKRWLLSEYNLIEETLELSSIDCSLALTEIYDKVELPKT